MAAEMPVTEARERFGELVQMAAADAVKRTRMRVIGAIELLALDPRPPGAKLLRGGEQGRWRARVGDYPIVDTIQDDRLIVLVLRVGHRREVYERSRDPVTR